MDPCQYNVISLMNSGAIKTVHYSGNDKEQAQKQLDFHADAEVYELTPVTGFKRPESYEDAKARKAAGIPPPRKKPRA